MAIWFERDASWSDHPNVSHAAKYHIASNEDAVFPACGMHVVLNKESGTDLPQQSRKCKRCEAVIAKKARK